MEDAEVGLPSPAVHNTPAVAATTYSSRWRRDARVLGSLPFRTLGSVGPPFCELMAPTLFREYLFFWQLGRGLFRLPARSSESAPCVASGPATRRVPTRASVRLSTVALFEQSYPALAVKAAFSLGCQPGSQLPFSSDRSLGRRPSGYSFTAWVQRLLHEQRQCADTIIEQRHCCQKRLAFPTMMGTEPSAGRRRFSFL